MFGQQKGSSALPTNLFNLLVESYTATNKREKLLFNNIELMKSPFQFAGVSAKMFQWFGLLNVPTGGRKASLFQNFFTAFSTSRLQPFCQIINGGNIKK